MPDSQLFGGGTRIRRFVFRVVRGADREGGQVRPQLGHGPAHKARVQPAAQQSPDGHVGVQAALHCREKEALGFLHRFVEGRGARGSYRGRPPVFFRSEDPVRPPDEGGRRHLGDVAVDGPLVGHETEFEKLGERFLVEIAGPIARAERTDGGGEGDTPIVRGIEERFYPEPVANQVEGALRVVPERKREHAAQAGDQAVDSPPPVSMQQDFRVGPAAEVRARGGQFRGQSAKIVDGAVEDDAQGTVGQQHRLASRIAQVEDGEAPMAEHHARPALDTLAVGPAPGERAGHVLDRV